jgi:hypothetical protein
LGPPISDVGRWKHFGSAQIVGDLVVAVLAGTGAAPGIDAIRRSCCESEWALFIP